MSDKDMEKIRTEKEQWEGKLTDTLKKRPERKPSFTNTSGIPLSRAYTPLDGEKSEYLPNLGFPGNYPFTRGVQPTMYRGRLWTMRQYSGFATAEETNRRYRYLLEKGQTGLSVAFDLPSQIGYNSDHPLSQGEVGKVGVAIDSVRDMEALFDGIPLDKVSTSMTINAPAAILLAMYIVVAEKQGVSPDKLNGTIQNDILKEYTSRGTYIFPPEPSMRIITDTFAYCSENVPNWNTISVSGYHMREAGCTAVQELAFTLANGIAYVNAAIEAGLDVDTFARRVSFFFISQQDFFEEIAKFRAARRLWARVMKERFGAKKPASWMLRFHVQTAGSTLTAQQPDNNVVRVAFQTLSAVLGGTQSLHSCSRDEALALPSEEAVRLSLRTQQLIAHESGVTEVVDPLGGSYYIEKLTDEIERRAMEYIKKIDQMGGAVKATEKGYIQKEIEESAYQYQKGVEDKSRIVVGVNEFVEEEEETPTDLLKVDPTVGESQIAKLKELRASRNQGQVESSLKDLKKAAENKKENLLPHFLNAVRSEATLGEICDTLREVFGEYKAV